MGWVLVGRRAWLCPFVGPADGVAVVAALFIAVLFGIPLVGLASGTWLGLACGLSPFLLSIPAASGARRVGWSPAVALRVLPVGGWLVIEDIIPAAEDFWRVVAALLPDHLETTLVRAKGGDMFVVRRSA